MVLIQLSLIINLSNLAPLVCRSVVLITSSGWYFVWYTWWPGCMPLTPLLQPPLPPWPSSISLLVMMVGDCTSEPFSTLLIALSYLCVLMMFPHAMCVCTCNWIVVPCNCVLSVSCNLLLIEWHGVVAGIVFAVGDTDVCCQGINAMCKLSLLYRQLVFIITFLRLQMEGES